MGMRITTNVAAINAQRQLVTSQRNIQNSMAQLSSGYRINRSADDAAGLAISENMKAQLRSLAQAKRNANDGISLVQTAEGAMAEINNLGVRLRELAIQASSDTVGENERGFINVEVQQLKSEIERIALSANWNSVPLLDGTTPVFDIQIGSQATENDVISYDASQNVATLQGLGLFDLDYSTKEGALAGIGALDYATQMVSGMRANIGALQNRLQSTIETLSVSEENIAAANSRIRDTDIAQTSSEMARNQVMLQAGTATLAQANQASMLAIKLIGS
ncbi:MAG: flagellin [Pseudobdellovibrio sp.]|jgi:flagellin|nr:flagellin [Pseudobdellovibrio sp.]